MESPKFKATIGSMGVLIALISLSFDISNSKIKGTSFRQSDSLITKWKEDSLGCKKIRSSLLIKKIIDKYELKAKGAGYVRQLLGEPNRIENADDSGIVLRYYFDTCCKNDKLYLEECDYSWVTFDYKNKLDNQCYIIIGVT